MKKILITGASGGIGSSIVKKFLSKNLNLVLTSSSESTLEKLKNQFGSDHFYYILNFNDQSNFENTLKKISVDHRDLSTIVNNAGVTDDSLILRMKTE